MKDDGVKANPPNLDPEADSVDPLEGLNAYPPHLGGICLKDESPEGLDPVSPELVSEVVGTDVWMTNSGPPDLDVLDDAAAPASAEDRLICSLWYPGSWLSKFQNNKIDEFINYLQLSNPF